MRHSDEADSVAEHGLHTLEKLIAEGDLEMAQVTFGMVGENIDLWCDAGQRERLEAVRAALDAARGPRGP